MTDKLSQYNRALGHLGQRKLASLGESREPRRVLDDYYDAVTGYCLERKFWNFIYRTAQFDASASVSPAFGFTYAFTIPDDWIRTKLISSSESLTPPLLQFMEEAGYWYANVTPIYVQYNSRHTSYGLDLSRWPESFADYHALRLAAQTCFRITMKDDLLKGPQGLLKREERSYRTAVSLCAMNDPVGFAPASRWVSSRSGSGLGSDFPTGTTLIP